MSKDQNTAAQERLGEILDQRAFDRFPEVWAADVVDHDPAPDQAPGLQGIVDFWTSFASAFPDFTATPEALVADDDHVSVVLTLSGTHSGDFQGHAPTGKSFTIRGIQVARFEDGKIVERWGSSDEKGLSAQLGLEPKPAHFV
jgi:steroid delta-isomerase-like uncharacterized protein